MLIAAGLGIPSLNSVQTVKLQSSLVNCMESFDDFYDCFFILKFSLYFLIESAFLIDGSGPHYVPYI